MVVDVPASPEPDKGSIRIGLPAIVSPEVETQSVRRETGHLQGKTDTGMRTPWQIQKREDNHPRDCPKNSTFLPPTSLTLILARPVHLTQAYGRRCRWRWISSVNSSGGVRIG